jgi:hypothetical protein
MNEEIARGMVCFFHQKKHFYLIRVTFDKFNFGPQLFHQIGPSSRKCPSKSSSSDDDDVTSERLLLQKVN